MRTIRLFFYHFAPDYYQTMQISANSSYDKNLNDSQHQRLKLAICYVNLRVALH